jgi:nitroreductase
MNDQMGISVVGAVKSRRSVRRFLDKPVDRDILKELLETALRAPSGTNIQPWQLHVLTGDKLKTFSQTMTQKFLDTSINPLEVDTWEYDYYDEASTEPYLSRRRKVGFELYSLAGIERGDTEGSLRQASLTTSSLVHRLVLLSRFILNPPPVYWLMWAVCCKPLCSRRGSMACTPAHRRLGLLFRNR